MSIRLLKDYQVNNTSTTGMQIIPTSSGIYQGAPNSISINNGTLMVGIKDKVVLSNDDLTSFDTTTSGNYGYFAFPPFLTLANDATATTNTNGLYFNATPQAFTYTSPQSGFATVDHIKLLVYRRDGDSPVTGANYSAFTAPTDGSELVYEITSAVHQNPMPSVPAAIAGGVLDPLRDPRLNCAGPAVLDPDNFFTFDVLGTDSMWYAIVEHLPFLKPGWPTPPAYPPTTAGDYHGFTHLVPLASRTSATPLTAPDNIKIAYNRAKGYVRWLINDEEKFRYEKIGFPLDPRFRVLDHNGPDVSVTPTRLCFGLALFTLLDAHEPSAQNLNDLALVQLCTPSSQYVNPRSDRTWPGGDPVVDTTFLDTSSLQANRIWGQGMQAHFQNSLVYTQLQISP